MVQCTTIAAVSTPRQRSAVAVIRISGRDAKAIASRVFAAIEAAPPRQMVYGEIRANGITDRAMGVYFAAPHSFTGEDTVELFPHGSLPVVDAVLDALYAAGAAAAKAGEFTMRAFLNGKIDLTGAEGIADMIDAETQTEAKAAARQMGGALKEKIESVSDRLAELIARLEVASDYPEEDLETETVDGGLTVMRDILAEVERMKDGYREGRMLRGGVSVAVAGPPNAGKSTLLNALLGYDRAIVTDTPGTTRDTIQESYIYKGVRFSVTDTAGLRTAADEIERQGIERTLAAIQEADLVLSLREAGKPGAQFDKCDKWGRGSLSIDADKWGRGCLLIDVQNKTDILSPDAGGTLHISAATGEGIENLKEHIYQLTAAQLTLSDGAHINNRRQLSEVISCASHLSYAIQAAQDKRDTELITFDLQAGLRALCRITGRDGIDEVTSQIFARFCVGK